MSRRTPRSTPTTRTADTTPSSSARAPSHPPKSTSDSRSSARTHRPRTSAVQASAAGPSSPLASPLSDDPSSPLRPNKAKRRSAERASGSSSTPRALGTASRGKARMTGRASDSFAYRATTGEVNSEDEEEGDGDVRAVSTGAASSSRGGANHAPSSAKRRRLDPPPRPRRVSEPSPTAGYASSDEDLSEDLLEVMKRAASQSTYDAEAEARQKEERRARREEELQLRKEEEDFAPNELPLQLRKFRTASDRRKHPLLVRSSGNWFPAYLVDFEPVRSVQERRAGKVDLWTVQIHPSESKRVLVKKEKDIMYIEDDRVAECPWPRIESFDEEIARSDALTRGPTPPPRADTVVQTPTPFAELGRRDQLYLLRPHCQALISEAYPPAQWRVDAFFRGDTKRLEKPRNKARGDIVENEVVSIIHPELQRWTLREAKATPTVAPPLGSDRFNDLNASGKRSFVDLVLEPETCIALCMRYMSAEELAEAELERRGTVAADGAGAVDQGEDEDANGVASWPALAPAPGVEPPSAKIIPDQLLRTTAAAPDAADLPEWAIYTLARQQLMDTTNVEAQERQLWMRLVALCNEARIAARMRLGVFDPHETMGKEERRRAELAKQGKTLSSSGRMTNRALGMAETVAEKSARRAAARQRE